MQDLAQPYRISFGQILLAIQARLMWRTELPETGVKLIGRDNRNVPKLSGDRDLLVRPSQFVEDVGAELGGGRINTILERAVYVFSRVRMARDETDRDNLWLTHETDGIFALEEAVIDALQEWFPTDQSIAHPTDKTGNQWTTRGLVLTNGQAPEKLIPTDSSWGHSCIAFMVRYLPPITPGPFGLGE